MIEWFEPACTITGEGIDDYMDEVSCAPDQEPVFEKHRCIAIPVSYTHLRAHETVLDLVCRLLLEKKNS